ncbi:hypothetical protein EXW31_28975 (plasmid) [Bacillus mycoides]|nr:hypothetical protein EXW31_28975 [Bacillus mycoides]
MSKHYPCSFYDDSLFVLYIHLKLKRTCRIPTSSFCFSYCIRIETFKYSRINNEVFISRLLTKILHFM